VDEKTENKKKKKKKSVDEILGLNEKKQEENESLLSMLNNTPFHFLRIIKLMNAT
jgi:hypothetical protein